MSLMIHRIFAVFATLMFAAGAWAEGLILGDPAPALQGKVTWLKGDAIDEFEEGNIYVLDFWATWCSPCIASIPHLNSIAQRHREDGVKVVGLAIWPRPGMAPTDEFVKGRGDGMDYYIAEDINGAVAEAYMNATNQQGIPTVMIVDREGRLAWLGHPSEMDPVLESVIDGSFDMELARRKSKLMREADAKLSRANELAALGMWDDAFEIVDEVIEMDHEVFGGYAVMKYQVLHVRLHREADAAAYGRKVVGSVLRNHTEALHQLAWFIIDAPIENPDLELARLAMDRAVELTEGEDANILDTMAALNFAKGNVDRAVTLQRRALELLEHENLRADFQERLEKYEAASQG